MRSISLLLIFLCPRLFAAQGDCIDDGQALVEAEMPKVRYEWFFVEADSEHTQASLLFPRELNGASFYQVLAQKKDDTLYEYAFPLEALDHPLTTEALQIAFIIQNEQMPDLVINVQYSELSGATCRAEIIYSYYLTP